ncbi:MAG: ATP-dependent DNA helicase [bacterium]
MPEISEIFAEQGTLAAAVPGFSYRAQQAEMAQRVDQALIDGDVLIAEAGTGTGKTFAYLVPALLSGLKVLISTGTRNLQDQLFLKDLPVVTEALASPANVALLKGRSNYLCIHRMENALQDPRGQRKEIRAQLLRIRDWNSVTRSGDIAEMPQVSEDSPVWPMVTSTTDNCLGSECPAFSKCHLVEARRRAQEADVVIINHHLLCADFSLKEDGFGELLPAADAFIIDEAHQLPEVASSFFGASVSSRQLLDLARDAKIEYQREAGDVPGFVTCCDSLETQARELRLAFGRNSRRGARQELSRDNEVNDALQGMEEALTTLHESLAPLKGRGKGLDSCLSRAESLLATLRNWQQEVDDDQSIRWFETFTQSLRLNSTPLDIANIFRAQMEQRPAAWVFTSATLAVGESFQHFEKQLGLEDAATGKWDSPFDYQGQALWYVPKGLPQPNEPGYTQAVMETALPLIEAAGGRTFLLFTSHRALREAAEWLEDRCEYPLLVQGDGPKSQLLERFVDKGNAVLLGTASFWEGVDVRGDALSLVIIDKLPFASPGDPVMQARLDAIRKRGDNPFMSFQVPQAAIALKQGAGRLIRDVTDRGVLVLCDPRLLKKSYGRTFLEAMPPFARTRESADVARFFNDC